MAPEETTFIDEDIVEPEEQQKQEKEAPLIDFLPPKEVKEQPPSVQVHSVGEETAFQVQEDGTAIGNVGVVFPANRDEVDSTRLVSFESPDVEVKSIHAQKYIKLRIYVHRKTPMVF